MSSFDAVIPSKVLIQGGELILQNALCQDRGTKHEQWFDIPIILRDSKGQSCQIREGKLFDRLALLKVTKCFKKMLESLPDKAVDGFDCTKIKGNTTVHAVKNGIVASDFIQQDRVKRGAEKIIKLLTQPFDCSVHAGSGNHLVAEMALEDQEDLDENSAHSDADEMRKATGSTEARPQGLASPEKSRSRSSHLPNGGVSKNARSARAASSKKRGEKTPEDPLKAWPTHNAKQKGFDTPEFMKAIFDFSSLTIEDSPYELTKEKEVRFLYSDLARVQTEKEEKTDAEQKIANKKGEDYLKTVREAKRGLQTLFKDPDGDSDEAKKALLWLKALYAQAIENYRKVPSKDEFIEQLKIEKEKRAKAPEESVPNPDCNRPEEVQGATTLPHLIPSLRNRLASMSATVGMRAASSAYRGAKKAGLFGWRLAKRLARPILGRAIAPMTKAYQKGQRAFQKMRRGITEEIPYLMTRMDYWLDDELHPRERIATEIVKYLGIKAADGEDLTPLFKKLVAKICN
jgi:hypothetical protein